MTVISARSKRSLWAITSYFNWYHFATKRSNYEQFRRGFARFGGALLTVECALHGEAFELENTGDDIIHVRTNSMMWQKERLLNIALEHLGPECRYVAWLDCDVLFHNAQWQVEVIRTLESACVVQLFSRVVRLSRGASELSPDSNLRVSFMRAIEDAIEGRMPPRPGDPGFAWAARREVLEQIHGLYDACIVGGADRLMAQAWFGACHLPASQLIASGHLRSHYEAWAKEVHRLVHGNVSCIQGDLFHLWHGEISNRNYYERHNKLAVFGFNPQTDIAVNEQGCWEWNSAKPELHSWMEQYFMGRREDG